ncbi:MAG: hypothetical protein H6888_07290 [Nitratireductor sp.]|nr:hypothetical protein [Nitratireductor sp.]MCC0020864.1 hypothetical protein [Nitratireductor sp.]
MLARRLAWYGLYSCGWLVLADAPFSGHAAMLVGDHVARDGRHRMWEVFSASAEARDGKPDPLDRWTKRIMDATASRADAVAIYPFDRPYPPFQTWAMAATGMKPSPLGILIHEKFGLWQAFRAFLVFGKGVELELPKPASHPCESCRDRPCLCECPVNAFSDHGFDVGSCRNHLASGNEPHCMSLGCRARAACPVGIPYADAQIRFHMQAFAG